MNNKKKGDKAENELANLFREKHDCLVDVSPRTMKPVFFGGKRSYVSGRNDYFGLFDLMVVYPKHDVQFIQVKSGSYKNVSAALKKIKEKLNYFDEELVYVYLRVPRKGWVAYCADGIKCFYDLKLNVCEKFTVSEKKVKKE